MRGFSLDTGLVFAYYIGKDFYIKEADRLKRKRRGLWITLAVLAALCIGCMVFLSGGYDAGNAATAALVGSERVGVTQIDRKMTVFSPESPEVGLVFYPGGLVEYTAYAPLMRQLADEGIMTVLLHMPLDLAFTNINGAVKVAEQYPEIKRWYIGGHSLGGVMAASCAVSGRRSFDGVILLASYSTKDLHDENVLSIYGSNDGVLNRKQYDKNRKKLPEDVTEVVLDGGIHAFFGDYGAQKGDGTPTITREEQTRQTARLILDFIHANGH